MTNNEALQLIKTKIGGEDSDLRNVLAQSALNSAVGAFNRLGQFEWNRQYVNFNLTSGTGSYNFSDIWPTHKVRRLEPKIWYVGKSGWIEILDYEIFCNLTKYRSTTAGTPQWATVHSKEGRLDLYPVPNSALACTAMLYVLITTMDEVPYEYSDLVVDKATMLAVDVQKYPNVYGAAERSWEQGVKEIFRHRRYTIWTGNQIGPDPWVTRSTTGESIAATDSGNLTG